ncbi:MAG: hypothetical protein NTX49_10140 [Chlamydiae bacterium]|nr:hypothetical protein [Chlamydiota bacterium]
MSVTATKASPAPSQVETSSDRRIGAEIDPKNPDDKKKGKASLHGIRDRIESTFQTVTAPLPFDRLSPAESVRREAHSSHEVQRRMDSHLSIAERAASSEEDRKSSGASLGAKVASIERPSRRKEPKSEAPTRSVSGASSHGPWPHVKVLPSREITLDMPTADTRISDEITRHQFARAMDSAPASGASPLGTGPARKSVGPSVTLTAAAWPQGETTPNKGAPYHGPHPHVKVLPSTQLNLEGVPTLSSITDRQAGFQLECSMAVARVAAAPIHALGYVVGATIKKLREQSPLVDLAARGAGNAVRYAKTWVKEEIPGSAEFVRDFRSNLSRLPGDIEEEYGIPQEKTRQWIEDTSAIATTTALAGAGLAVAGKSMLATSDAVAVVAKGKPPTFIEGTYRVIEEPLATGPLKVLPSPRRLLTAPPKVAAEVSVPAAAAAPVATTRDWVVTNIAANRAAHPTAAYRAFDRAVTAASLIVDAKPPVVTNSSTPPLRVPRADRPFHDHNTYEPMEPSRIPIRDTAQPTTFHRRVETVRAYGNLYDIELACMRHECGTWSLFANTFTPHNPQALTSASSGRVLAKVRSALIHVARDHLEAPAVVIQWNPQALPTIADFAEGAAKRTVHYAGEMPAIDTLSPMGSLQRLGNAVLGARLDIPAKAMPIDGQQLRFEDKAFNDDILGYAGHFFVDPPRGTHTISATDSLLTAVRSLKWKERPVPTVTFDLQRKRKKDPSLPKAGHEPLALEDAVAAAPSRAAQAAESAPKPLTGRVSLTSTRPLIPVVRSTEETVVVVQSTWDTSGAFRIPITQRLKQFAKGRNLVYREVDSAQGVAEAMQVSGNVSHVLVRAHGNPRAVHFDPRGTKAEELAYLLRKASYIAGRRAQLFLEACSTAAEPLDGSPSLAHKVDGFLRERVSIVAARSAVIPNFTRMKPGSVQFYGEIGRDQLNRAIPDHLRYPELTFRIGRINNSEIYKKLIRGERIPSDSRLLHFSEPPKIFSGVIPRDLVFVQYHIGHQPFNTWFVSAEDAKALTTMDAIRRQTVLSDSAAPFTHMTVTRIPAGETINALRGNVTSEGKWDTTVRLGQTTQHYFYDFDPKWEKATLPWPCSSEGLDNFDALLKAATESRDPRRTLSLRPQTRHEEATAASISQPLVNPVAAGEGSSIPPISDALPETFQEILTNIEYNGEVADLRISRIAHKDGTCRVFVEHLIIQDCEVGDQTLTSGLIFQALSSIRVDAERELGASRVFIQWNPMNPKCLAPSFQAHLERYRHYVGLHEAYSVHPELMEKFQANEELRHLKYPTLAYDLKAPSLEEEIPASALPSRYDNSARYGKYSDSFLNKPKEFDGVLAKDLVVARFCGGTDTITGYNCTWFTPITYLNSLATLEEVMESAAILSRFGERNRVIVARIPAGSKVQFLHGRAAPQVDSVSGEIRSGGIVQYQFKDFDPAWVKDVRSLNTPPASSHFGPLVKAPTEGRDPNGILSLGSITPPSSPERISATEVESLPTAGSLSKLLRKQAENPLALFSADAKPYLKVHREYVQAVMKKGKTFDRGFTPKFPVEAALERTRQILCPSKRFAEVLAGSGANPFDLQRGAEFQGHFLTDGKSSFSIVEKRMSEVDALAELKGIARFKEQDLFDLQVPEIIAVEIEPKGAAIFSAYETSPTMMQWAREISSDPIMAREAFSKMGVADAELHSSQYGRHFVPLAMRKKYIAELVANYHLVREVGMKLGIKVEHKPEAIRNLTREFEENDHMVASFGIDPSEADLSNRSYSPKEDAVMVFSLAESSALINAGGSPLGHPMYYYKSMLSLLKKEAIGLGIDEAKLVMPYKEAYRENFEGDISAEAAFWNVYTEYEEYKNLIEMHSNKLPVGAALHSEDLEALWSKV